ncbi:MAG: hypothetical protein ACJA1C_000104 [Crocinitomicaceae bacterium]|jgi:hypothetical protein
MKFQTNNSMPLKLLIASILFLIVSSCTPDVDVEEEAYLNLKKEFKKEKIDLKKELNKLERFLVEKDVLSSKSSKSKRAYLKFVAKNDSFPILENFDDRLVVLNSPLDLQFLASAIKAVQKSNQEEFKGSELKALLDRLESGDLDKRSAPKTIAQALLNVDNEEFKKPLYRAMTLILIASSMSDNRESKDWVIKDEDDYYDVNGFHSWSVLGCGIERRNIFDVAIDSGGLLLVRGEIIEDFNLISVELTKQISINRNLTRAETMRCLQHRSYKGINYPFYSHTTLDEIEENIEMSLQQLKVVIETPGVEQDIIEFKYMKYAGWYEKLELLRSSKRNALEEIHFQSHIEVEFKEETSEYLVEKVYEEIYESIYALRNKESIEIFGEDFETIKARQNIFLNDFNKLRLIEVSFPIRIMENQKQLYPEPMLEEPLVVVPPAANEP